MCSPWSSQGSGLTTWRYNADRGRALAYLKLNVGSGDLVDLQVDRTKRHALESGSRGFNLVRADGQKSDVVHSGPIAGGAGHQAGAHIGDGDLAPATTAPVGSEMVPRTEPVIV